MIARDRDREIQRYRERETCVTVCNTRLKFLFHHSAKAEVYRFPSVYYCFTLKDAAGLV